MGNTVRFNRSLAYLHGFETALEMANGRQPRLHEYRDLLEEIKPELGNNPSNDQELEAISALEPILAQIFTDARCLASCRDDEISQGRDSIA